MFYLQFAMFPQASTASQLSFVHGVTTIKENHCFYD